MDGIELGREIARLRAEGRTRAKFAVLWQSQPEATAATAAEWVASVREPQRRFDALRRRPGPDRLPTGWGWGERPTRGPLAGGR